MELAVPSLSYRKSFAEAVEEMRGAEGIGFWNEVGPPKDIEDYIRIRNDHSEGKSLPEGWIPASTFWLIDDGVFVGETNIRHQLTDHLRTVGGQIGYWIRPSRRNQGYGMQILHLALSKAKDLGLGKIVITCDETNIGSRRIIEGNGGVYERAQDMGAGNPRKLIFWIGC